MASSFDTRSKLDSREYHVVRSSLNNAQLLFEREKKGRVVFLGGSITYNGGWRDSLSVYLSNRFPETEFDFINAGIPSFGSTPGAFRFDRDVLANGRVDLLFLEAAVNDRAEGIGLRSHVLGMEGIVRHARQSNPAMDIVIMHFVDPQKISEYRKGHIPAEISIHEKVAAHYNISTINLAREVTERIENEEFSWENDFIDLHPSPFGQSIYYQSMKSLLNKMWGNSLPADRPISVHAHPNALDRASFSRGMLVPAVQAELVGGWFAHSNWVPSDQTGTRHDFVNVPMLVAEEPGEVLAFSFEGNATGIAVAAGYDAGIIEYRIDSGTWNRLDLFTQWSSQLHLPVFHTLAYGLPNGQHTLEIRVLSEKNDDSQGTSCRIRYFYVNR